MIDVIKLTQSLIRCPSITPVDAGAQDLLAKVLRKAGFECFHLPFEDVPNLFARIGNAGPHLCYAGHTDVVPPGPEARWTFGPFNPEVKDGVLYGRGVSDMKGSVAAFAAAVINYITEKGAPKGSVSLLITGDEEDLCINGTVKVLEWMSAHGHVPDACLVGEPSNPKILGEEMKIGRRGSLSGEIIITGKQGHVAYPERGKNPVPVMIALLDRLSKHVFDEGTDFFPPTNLEITTVDVGNKADNVIPESIFSGFNVRFNDLWTAKSLEKEICRILDECNQVYDLKTRSTSESFITKPGAWTDMVSQAVTDITGRQPRKATGGGTSDARFIQKYCPVVEFGGINQTIHQIDEHAHIQDLEDLEKIYRRLLEIYFEKSI